MMTERDDYVKLLAAALQGVLSSPRTVERADEVRAALLYADRAIAAVKERYPAGGRHTWIEGEQRRFAEKMESNGHESNGYEK